MTDQEKELIKTTTRIVQDMAYKLSDLCERYPDGAAVFFLAAEQLHIRALLPLLSEKDRQVFEILTTRATTTVLPFAFDPRKRGGETEHD